MGKFKSPPFGAGSTNFAKKKKKKKLHNYKVRKVNKIYTMIAIEKKCANANAVNCGSLTLFSEPTCLG